MTTTPPPFPGLKSQHVTSIEWLARATGADVEGLAVGSKTLEFRPRPRAPGDIGFLLLLPVEESENDSRRKRFQIRAESPAASALLIFQAVFPLLLFAGDQGETESISASASGGNASDEPPPIVELTISGGTNVSFSPSYEYLDQILLPALEAWFGVRVERRLECRGWSSGPSSSSSRGSLWFGIHPLPRGAALTTTGERGLECLGAAPRRREEVVESVEATIIAPADMHGDLEGALRAQLASVFPGAGLDFRRPEESGHESRIYVLLVARSDALRWGRDVLYGGKRKGKGKSKAELSRTVARMVAGALGDEVRKGGVVDGFLQDQLVIFQALAQGRTSFPGRARKTEGDEGPDGQVAGAVEDGLEKLHVGEELRRDRVKGPLGDPETDSNHTRTARWVTSEILGPRLKWYDDGVVCDGIGLISGN